MQKQNKIYKERNKRSIVYMILQNGNSQVKN